MNLINEKKGQSTIEYALLIGVVLSALLMIQVYARRSIQAVVKIAADELGTQAEGLTQLDHEKGELYNASSQTDSDSQINTREFYYGGTQMNIEYDTTHKAGGSLYRAEDEKQ